MVAESAFIAGFAGIISALATQWFVYRRRKIEAVNEIRSILKRFEDMDVNDVIRAKKDIEKQLTDKKMTDIWFLRERLLEIRVTSHASLNAEEKESVTEVFKQFEYINRDLGKDGTHMKEREIAKRIQEKSKVALEKISPRRWWGI
ncbi:hypothetical protein [Halorussus caseinilyticus]|uniref:hypothetical protein n=1 Tax=Halorussus caseinilyticus TaxID=3034025 RepID=UPI0023E8738A|nr:hypothetical protein [Halorussus sp. DT72]